jgi:CarD family transcriptional regulator
MEVAGRPLSFYRLALLGEGGGDLFVPVDKAEKSGLRRLLRRSEIPRLLELLAERNVATAKDWKQRAGDNLKRLTSGSAFDLVEVIDSLTGLGETKELSLREQWILTKARRLLISEIAEVMRESREMAEEQIDEALKVRRMSKPPKHQHERPDEH